MPFLAAFFLALLIFCLGASAQSGAGSLPRSILDEIARWLDRAGEKTQEWITPPFGPLGSRDLLDSSGLVQWNRAVSRNCPVGAAANISIRNEFGEVRIDTWENAVVRVEAEVFAAAESLKEAQEIANSIDVGVAAENGHVEVRTGYPDIRDRGRVVRYVNYVITVPRDAALQCRNRWGDTIVHGCQGAVSIDSQFGVVDLSDLDGPVRVEAGGEFPLQARHLEKGGVFHLWGTQAEFSDISRALDVRNFAGPTTIGALPAETEVRISNYSAPVHLYLEEGAAPHLEADVVFGGVRSDVPLSSSVVGDLETAEILQPESKQRVFLDVWFADLEVHRPAGGAPLPTPATLGGEDTEAVMDLPDFPVEDGREVVIDAIAGDVTVEVTDEPCVKVHARQTVRMIAEANASAAIEALTVTAEEGKGAVLIQSAVRGNMQDLGCVDYRVDLNVRCPRTSPVRISARGGRTQVDGVGGAVTVNQEGGEALVQHAKGDLNVTMKNGHVKLWECAGAATVAVEQGNVDTRNVRGRQEIQCVQGETVIDAPYGELHVRQSDGDVRVIPLEGIFGKYDIRAENGNVTILVPESADATVFATAHGGAVRPAFPLTGEVRSDYQRLQGRPVNDSPGTHEIRLETQNGDIVID